MTRHPSSESPAGDPIAAFAAPVALAGSATALVMVDFQQGFASRSAGLGRLLAARGVRSDYRFHRLETLAVPNAARLLTAFREAGLPRVFLVSGALNSDYSDVPPHLVGLFRAAGIRAGEREYEVLDELAPLPDEPVLHKRGLSGVLAGDLDRVLREMEVTTAVFAGVTTNMCVEHNLRDAADRGFACVLAEDACATDDPDMHDAALRNVGRLYGRVATAGEVIAELSRERAHA